MTTFPVGTPRTIFDWVALRDEFHGKVELLHVDSMFVMYGLSNMIEYRDDEFSREVEVFLSRSEDPIRARFDFAYLLASSFWDTYEVWCLDIFHAGKSINTSHLLPELRSKVMTWLMDGLKAYADQMEVMDLAYYVVSRIGNYDTFLEEDDVLQLEDAARKEISFKTSAGGRRILGIVVEAIEEERKKKDTNTSL